MWSTTNSTDLPHNVWDIYISYILFCTHNSKKLTVNGKYGYIRFECNPLISTQYCYNCNIPKLNTKMDCMERNNFLIKTYDL